MLNNHYVPQFILRNFGDKVDVYNIKTNELEVGRSTNKIFCEFGLYTDEMEHELNYKIETQFAGLLKEIVNNDYNEIVLKRPKLNLIKKFLLIALLRTRESDQFISTERYFYDNLKNNIFNNYKIDVTKEINKVDNFIFPPFMEKDTQNLSNYEYWMLTLQTILDSDGTPESIIKQARPTYAAFRWSSVVQAGFLGFWKSNKKEPFIIADNGMTSENEVGWDGILVHNHKKINYIMSCLKALEVIVNNDSIFKSEIYRQMMFLTNFSENFMMFSISKKLMLVLISPFYKFRKHMELMGCKVPPLDSLTCLVNENLYAPNKNVYINKPNIQGFHEPNTNDEYIYDMHELSFKETKYVNCLMLDRIYEYVGFSDYTKNESSIIDYAVRHKYGVPRIDYNGLVRYIKERHL